MALSMSRRETLACAVPLQGERDGREAVVRGRTPQARQPKLVELVHLVGELAVVLYDVDIVGARQETGKGGGVGVP